jgi:hypothetical protein
MKGTTLTAIVCGLLFSSIGLPQTPAPRPGTPVPLAYKTEWKPAEKFTLQEPITQARLLNANLELKLYGAYKPDGLLFSHQFKEQVPHVFNGLCSPTCALAFREKDNFVDLSGLGKVRWITMINGLHQIRLVLKLADGTWLMSDQTTGYSSDYHVSEFVLRDIRWRHLDIEKVGEAADGKWFDKPDLSKVDEVGWTDMTPGIGHGQGGWADVGWIEVYGTMVKRQR